jgi:hypothetical protein
MKRTLMLKRENLTALTSDEMTAVAGAAYTVPTCQVDRIRLVVEALITELPEITRTCNL